MRFLIPILLSLSCASAAFAADDCSSSAIPDGMPFGIALCKKSIWLSHELGKDWTGLSGNIAGGSRRIAIRDGLFETGGRLACFINGDWGRCTFFETPPQTVKAGAFSLSISGAIDVGFSNASPSKTAMVLSGQLTSGEAPIQVSGSPAIVVTQSAGEYLSVHNDGSFHCGFLKAPVQLSLGGISATITQASANWPSGYIWAGDEFGDLCANADGSLERGWLERPTRLKAGGQSLLIAAELTQFHPDGSVAEGHLLENASFAVRGKPVAAVPGEIAFYPSGALKAANVPGGETFELAPLSAREKPQEVTLPARDKPYRAEFREDGILKEYGRPE